MRATGRVEWPRSTAPPRLAHDPRKGASGGPPRDKPGRVAVVYGLGNASVTCSYDWYSGSKPLDGHVRNALYVAARLDGYQEGLCVTVATAGAPTARMASAPADVVMRCAGAPW